MNDNDLRNISDGEYRRLMTEAYPSPKKDIRAAVMAEIAAEASQTNKKAKILTPKRRNLIVKFGSMAACLVLLVTLGFRIVPMMTNKVVMEDTAAAEAVIVTTENTAADSEPKKNAPAMFAAKLTAFDASEENDSPEEAYDDAAEEGTDAISAYSILADTAEEVVLEAEETPAAPPMMMAAPPIAEEAVEECVVEEAVEECAAETAVPRFESELKLLLTEEINTETYAAWLTDHSYTSPDHWSIAEFVTVHGISRDRFTELHSTLTASFADNEIIRYDLDKLYGEDPAVAESIADGVIGTLIDAMCRK